MFISYFNFNWVDHYIISQNLNENQGFVILLMLSNRIEVEYSNWVYNVLIGAHIQMAKVDLKIEEVSKLCYAS